MQIEIIFNAVFQVSVVSVVNDEITVIVDLQIKVICTDNDKVIFNVV